MTEPDYKIEELFDLDTLLPYYCVLKLNPIGEYGFIKRCEELNTAKLCVRLMRKYRKPIYHYVED